MPSTRTTTMSTPISLNTQHGVARPPAYPQLLSLSVELVDLIVVSVCADDADGSLRLRALSLLSKCFTSACQKALFRAVTLQPTKFALDNQEENGPDTQSRFATLVRESPHLAAFVKTLTYRFPYGSREERTDISNSKLASALSKLVNVTEVHLEGSEGEKTSWGWRQIRHLTVFEETRERRQGPGGVDAQLLRIMERPTTKLLRMRNIEISIEQISKCPGVDNLQLDNTILAYPPSAYRYIDLNVATLILL